MPNDDKDGLSRVLTFCPELVSPLSKTSTTTGQQANQCPESTGGEWDHQAMRKTVIFWHGY